MRMSIRELEKDENKEQRYAFLRGWKGIKELDPSNKYSFWSIASYHGEPFNKPGAEKDVKSWGGYCQHQNVLFPLWHRFYVCEIEKALQSIEPTAVMHYWDQTSEESLKNGIPDLLMDAEVFMDDSGKKQPNPLRSYTFQKAITAHESEGYGEEGYYQKDEGYVTKRYPLSGICYPEEERKKAEAQNKKMHTDYPTDVSLNSVLNQNVINATTNKLNPRNIERLYEQCLQAPNYNIFSNTETAGMYKEHIALEDPHNQIHLAVGGFDIPGQGQSGLITGANGDMGENETAAFDPIFFLHHCNVDRMFWVWQQMHGATKELEILFTIPNDAGITPAAGQGPTPGQEMNEKLTLDTPLYPYKDSAGKTYTGRQCINIADLGFDYTKGSLTDIIPKLAGVTRVDNFGDLVGYENKTQMSIEMYMQNKASNKLAMGETGKIRTTFFNLTDFDQDEIKKIVMTTTELNAFNYQIYLKAEYIPRDNYPGSFLVKAYYTRGGCKIYLGMTAVMDRWQRKNCQNCQNHRYATATFRLDPSTTVSENPKLDDYLVEIEYHSPADGRTNTEAFNLHEKIGDKISGKFVLTGDN